MANKAIVSVDHWERSLENVSVTGRVDGIQAAAVIPIRRIAKLVADYDADPAANWPPLRLELAKTLKAGHLSRRVKPVMDGIEV